MVTGATQTGSLRDSLDTAVDEARLVREYIGPMVVAAEKHTLSPNTGLDWKEVDISKMTATGITESTDIKDNAQQYVDTPRTVTPQLVGIHTFVTRRTRARIATVTLEKLGPVAQNAMNRKKDEDGLTILDSATTTGPGAGATVTSGNISAFKTQISSNTTEGAVGQIFTVAHGFQIKDFWDEITGGVGTSPIPQGITEAFLRNGFSGMLAGTIVLEDGNITIDSSADAKGGVFAREGVLLIQGLSPYALSEERPSIGGGGTSIYLYDEYAWAIRLQAWVKELYSDATTPTS